MNYTHTQLEAVLRQDLTSFTEKSFKAVNPGADTCPIGTSRPSLTRWSSATDAKSGGSPSPYRRAA